MCEKKKKLKTVSEITLKNDYDAILFGEHINPDDQMKQCQKLDKRKWLSQKLGISPTVWDESKKIYITNPILIKYEQELKEKRSSSKLLSESIDSDDSMIEEIASIHKAS